MVINTNFVTTDDADSFGSLATRRRFRNQEVRGSIPNAISGFFFLIS